MSSLYSRVSCSSATRNSGSSTLHGTEHTLSPSTQKQQQEWTRAKRVWRRAPGRCRCGVVFAALGLLCCVVCSVVTLVIPMAGLSTRCHTRSQSQSHTRETYGEKRRREETTTGDERRRRLVTHGANHAKANARHGHSARATCTRGREHDTWTIMVGASTSSHACVRVWL